MTSNYLLELVPADDREVDFDFDLNQGVVNTKKKIELCVNNHFDSNHSIEFTDINVLGVNGMRRRVLCYIAAGSDFCAAQYINLRRNGVNTEPEVTPHPKSSPLLFTMMSVMG